MQYKFEDIAINSTAKKKPTEEDKDTYIGLEHLDSDCLYVTRWGADAAPTGEKLLMKKGDVLFGKRRAYQRKVGIAPFDGIFSAHGMVLRPNEEIIDKKFFPFFISSDQFMERAVRISVGGLSPTINWKDLRIQEFDLPPIEEQRILADKLWAAYRLKESYKKLLTATQEMVKSQFIEMFAFQDLSLTNPSDDFGKKCYDDTSSATKVPVGDYQNKGRYAIYDQSQDSDIAGYTDSIEGVCNNYPAVLFGDHSRVIKYINQPFYIGADGVKIIRPKEDDLLPEFLYYDLLYHNIPNTGYNRHFKYVKMLKLTEASIDEQKKFLKIAQQADKSEFVGCKSQFIEMFGNPLSSVQRYPLKNLGGCCELNPRRPSLDLEDTDNVSFVPMPSVSENGYLQDVTDEEYGKVKKGFTYFENGDVLFAKITPCMENGKGAIAEGLTNNIGMGSTEFHVLRPIEGVSSPYWLLALTRLSIFREKASKNMTGTGGQKRVPANYLENFMVGLPPIEEQNRFENIYKQADKSEYYNWK